MFDRGKLFYPILMFAGKSGRLIELVEHFRSTPHQLNLEILDPGLKCEHGCTYLQKFEGLFFVTFV